MSCVVDLLIDLDDARLGPVGTRIAEAGTCLLNLVQRLKELPHVLSRDHCRELLHIYLQFVSIAQPLNLFSPKVHLMVHLICRAEWHGNPILYSTWADEGANKVLRKVCRNCHQSTFETAVLLNYDELTRRTGKQRLQ